MAKVQIKSEQITPFGGIFCVMEEFDALLSNIIDSTLGTQKNKIGYQYSEIFRSLMCVFFVAAPVLKTYPPISCLIFPFILC